MEEPVYELRRTKWRDLSTLTEENNMSEPDTSGRCSEMDLELFEEESVDACELLKEVEDMADEIQRRLEALQAESKIPEDRSPKRERFTPQFIDGISPPENWKYSVWGIFRSMQDKQILMVNDPNDDIRKKVLNATQLMSIEKNVSNRRYSWFDYVENTPPVTGSNVGEC
jgi:hypothetical protein